MQVVLASPIARSAGPVIGPTGLARMAGAIGVGIFAGYVFVVPGLAAVSIAGLLEVPVGAPLLAVRRLVLDVDGRPVQWLQGLYRPDRYEYRMDLWRGGDEEARVWVQKDEAARP